MCYMYTYMHIHTVVCIIFGECLMNVIFGETCINLYSFNTLVQDSRELLKVSTTQIPILKIPYPPFSTLELHEFNFCVITCRSD